MARAWSVAARDEKKKQRTASTRTWTCSRSWTRRISSIGMFAWAWPPHASSKPNTATWFIRHRRCFPNRCARSSKKSARGDKRPSKTRSLKWCSRARTRPDIIGRTIRSRALSIVRFESLRRCSIAKPIFRKRAPRISILNPYFSSYFTFSAFYHETTFFLCLSNNCIITRELLYLFFLKVFAGENISIVRIFRRRKKIICLSVYFFNVCPESGARVCGVHFIFEKKKLSTKINK